MPRPPVRSSARLFKRFPRFASFFDGGLDPETADVGLLRQTRVVSLATVAMSFVALPFVFQYAALGLPHMVWAFAGTLVGCGVNLWLLRRLHRPTLAGNLAISLLFILVLISNFTSGGFYDPNFAWLYLVPVSALAVVGLRAGWVWAGVATVTTVVFWMLPGWGFEFPNLVPADRHAVQSLLNRLMELLGLGVLATSFVIVQRRTERALGREVESRRRAEQEARAADLGKSELLTNVSHELRTPLTAILGTADLLRGEAIDGRLREMVETVNISAETLLALVDDLLDFSRMDQGHFTLQPSAFRLADLLEEVLRLIRPRAAQKGLDLHLAAAPELPEALSGDRERLRQVLLNLMSNAVKFTETGSVTLTVRPEGEIGETLGEMFTLRFAVRDTGVGIAPEDCERIFQPFRQADSSASRRQGGSGLGLTICQRLLGLMGGSLGVESSLGVGSTFWFQVPVETAAPPAADAPRGPAAALQAVRPRHTLRILVVDDNETNRWVLCQMLEVLGYSYREADSGEAALAAFDGERFDAVLMDCQMPDLDGYATTRRLRMREAPGRRTVVIAVTAHALAGEREKCLAAGMDDYLAKPFRREELGVRLDRWLAVEGGEAGESAASRETPPQKPRADTSREEAPG